MSRPVRISINALGGQGGGVLADWIVDVAQAAGWWVQSTSVPGVAQRTGATVYYIEVAPPGPEPVLALMPVPGDVDVVIAAELMEAGRAVARGLVTPDRTTLIAASHRIFAIEEKSAMGDGAFSAATVLAACEASARRFVLADFEALAAAHRSVISATLLGALAGSAALPFARADFEAAIQRAGVGVAASLAAFGAAFDVAAGRPQLALVTAAPAPVVQPVSVRIGALPGPARASARLGVERLLDYQDRAYADLYLDRLEQVGAAERQCGGDGALAAATARHLALWMSYEDVVRVADLKTRGSRGLRVAAEVRAPGGVLTRTTEFMHPRFEELCDTLPARLGRWLGGSARARAWLTPLMEQDREIATSSLGGFLLLWGLARLRRFRPGSLRFAVETQRIEAWLASAVNAARGDLGLAVEIVKLQRLVRGYSDTHARGLANFAAIMRALPALSGRPDAAATVAMLHKAALADDESRALAAALTRLEAPALQAAA